MAPFVQDSAPPGGYQSIQYAKEFIPKRVNGYLLIGGFLAGKVAAIGYYLLVSNAKRRRALLEENDSRVCLQPFFEAEADRSKLKHYRACKEEEAHLMRNDPDWKVGTYYGEEKYPDDSDIFRGMYTDVTLPFEEIGMLQAMKERALRLVNQVL